MSTLSVSFNEISGTPSSSFVVTDSNRKQWMAIEHTSSINVIHWDIQQSLTQTKNKKDKLTLKSKLFLNFRYYPILSISMLAPALASMTLLWAYWMYDAATINPGILLWSLVGFGGMYIVLTSAAREIYGAKKQTN